MATPKRAWLTIGRVVGVLLVLQLGLAAETSAQEGAMSADTTARLSESRDADGGPYFYRGLPYGSEAFMGPLDVILNKGFALAQTERNSRTIFDYPYGVGHVSDALTHPLKAIQRGGGWWEFLRKELFPLSYGNDSKWYTNYTGHLIEGGIHWRRLMEWYDAHGVPLPGLLSAATSVTAALLNEMYEHPRSRTGAAATVADLYVFDLAGMLLFSQNGIARFFARSLHTNVWPGQASITFPSGEIQNNTNYLVFKIPWGVVPNSSIFFWTGIGAQLGLTFHRSDGLDLSLALGSDAKRMHVDPVTGEETAELAASAGLFLDRNNSLLASVRLSELKDRLLSVNVYPGVIRVAGGSFGAWMILTRDLQIRLGITNRYWLGAGLGLGW